MTSLAHILRRGRQLPAGAPALIGDGRTASRARLAERVAARAVLGGEAGHPRLDQFSFCRNRQNEKN